MRIILKNNWPVIVSGENHESQGKLGTCFELKDAKRNMATEGKSGLRQINSRTLLAKLKVLCRLEISGLVVMWLHERIFLLLEVHMDVFGVLGNYIGNLPSKDSESNFLYYSCSFLINVKLFQNKIKSYLIILKHI